MMLRTRVNKTLRESPELTVELKKNTEARLTLLSSALTKLGLSLNLLFKKSSRTREESVSDLKIIRKVSRTDIEVFLVNGAGEEIGKARANLVGSDYGTDFHNLLNDQNLWQQHRELNPEYRGIGLGKDMLVALHEAVRSAGGVCVSFGMVSKSAIDSNLRSDSGFKKTPIIVIIRGTSKIVLPADISLAKENLNSIGIKLSDRDVSDFNRAVETPYGRNRGGSIMSGLMVELDGASCDIPVIDVS